MSHSLRRLTIIASLVLPFCAMSQSLPTTPALHSGETLVYQLEISGSRSTKVESLVTTPQTPPADDLTARCLLQVNVVQANASGWRLKTYLSDRNASVRPGDTSRVQPAAPDKLIEVFIAPDGRASEIKGLADLTVPRQTAWTAWLSRFTSPLAFPKAVRQGQRWKTSENETSPSPIAGLSWERRYEYAQQAGCGGADTGNAGQSSGAADLCAVIFVHAQLRQKSSPQNATPEDYRRRGLATSGTATGTNETILYISTKTGLLVRSTEDIQQSMDVTISLADKSNKVRYLINAKSRQQVQLLPDTPQDVR